ncbi:C6 zinc finger [Fusarium pseudocircinatum]|uniref:C6 zinc finger n=1 Tax=Fusarium pseudocircinatum TaxID=56676 RepID=A0A8H5L3U0_9HYPO|nr:C6 zinc finger [Fusarium pseudocircinatum]
MPRENRTAKVNRRRHTKTRKGCATCKRRKIKCDESRPSCSNCVKHDVECDFALATRELSSRSTAPLNRELNLLDLELLNNFTSSTVATFGNDPVLRTVWKTAVVREAFGCEYLMRAVLSVSAAHIAHHRPALEQYYMSHALSHHEIASRAAIDLIASPPSDQYEKLWIFSVLTVFFALASSKDPNASLLICENVLPNWLLLLSGVQELSENLNLQTYSGILSPIFKRGSERMKLARELARTKDDKLLEELEIDVRRTVKDTTELVTYIDSIEVLRCQLGMALFPPSDRQHDLDLSSAFAWYFMLPRGFMPLLKQMKQEAVAIFAHSLILLKLLQGYRWVQGWDIFLLSRVWEILDDEHRLWIQWPIEEIGWVSP